MNARTLRSLAAAIAIPILPSTVLAQGDGFTLEAAPEKEPEIIYLNEVEVGVGYTTVDSFKFGEYSGLDDDGPYAIGSFYLLRRPAYDSNETPRYWEVEGTNLGLDSRSLYGEYGVQGNYKLFLEYDQIPHNQFSDGATPFIGAGTTSLTLPAGWDPGVAGNPTPAQMSLLLPSLRGIEVETERKNFGAGGVKYFGKRWKLGVDFHHDTKEGIDTIGASFAASGGNPKAMILPEPIDYETNRFSVFAEYVDRKSMYRLGYELSSFSNNAPTLRFRNPYNARAGWAAGAGFPTGVGEYQLEPDNMAHSLSLSAARNFGMTSRIAGSLSYTRYTQDERFLPYTANPILAATVTVPLPRNSLDGEISTTILDLAYSSRPMRKLDVSAAYRLEYRENDTPSNTYTYIAGDAETQAGGDTRTNLPYGGGTTHKVKLDTGYRLMPQTKISFGYQYEQRERDIAEVAKTREHTFSTKLSAAPFEMANGWIRYAHSERSGSNYRDALLHVLSTPLDPPGAFENDPRLRKYNLADRDRDEVRGVLSYSPDPMVSVTFDGSFSRNSYPDTAIGLSEQRFTSATLDTAFMPREDLSGNVFVTYENIRSDQLGCSWSPGGACVTAPPAPADSWTADIEDNVYTVGFGGDWQVNERLSVGPSYSFSVAMTDTEVMSAAPFAPLPKLLSRRHSIGFHLDYKLKKNLTTRFGYAYEYLKTNDFALDNVAVDTLNDVITLGQSSQDYSGHVFGMSVKYKF